MKKLIALILAVLLLASLAGCRKETPPQESTPAPDNSPTQSVPPESEPPEESAPPVEPEITADNWGISERWAAENEESSKNYFINFPCAGGATSGYGLGGEQGDGTEIYVFGQNDYAPPIDSIYEIFPTYFEQLEKTLVDAYTVLAKNFEFALTGEPKDVTVGDYDMVIFTGTIDYDYRGDHYHYNFVSYATTLKSNGAYAYWVVYDISGDQSKGDLIAEHALNMAKTFREIE